MPGVVDGTSYGTPAFRVRGKLFVRFKGDGESIVIRIPVGTREEMIATEPETYFITDHYRDYPQYILVRLPSVRPDALKDLIHGAVKLTAGIRKISGHA